jgi:thiopurine S-methyltransferase
VAPDRGFWQERWDRGEIGFHQGKPNDLLVAHVAALERAPRMRILVPLSGKAVDLCWLAARGHEVVGVEFVEKAIEEFFAEQGLDGRRRAVGRHEAVTAEGVTLIRADFFDVRPEDVGRFDAVYDRAALIALDPKTRARYVEACRALLSEGGITFLISAAYDQSRRSGPPWSVDRREVEALFAPRRASVLESRTTQAPPSFAELGVPTFTETAYLVSSS